MKNKKLTKQQEKFFEDKTKDFKYLLQNRTSYFQSLVIVFGAAAVILLIDLIAQGDMVSKLIFILILFVITSWAYKKSLVQTQKPVLSCMNAQGVIEKGPIEVEGKDGKKYVVFGLRDFKYQKI